MCINTVVRLYKLTLRVEISLFIILMLSFQKKGQKLLILGQIKNMF